MKKEMGTSELAQKMTNELLQLFAKKYALENRQTLMKIARIDSRLLE